MYAKSFEWGLGGLLRGAVTRSRSNARQQRLAYCHAYVHERRQVYYHAFAFERS